MEHHNLNFAHLHEIITPLWGHIPVQDSPRPPHHHHLRRRRSHNELPTQITLLRSHHHLCFPRRQIV